MDYDKVLEYSERIVYKSSEFRKYITDETQDIQWVDKNEAKDKLDESKNSILNVIENFLISRGLDKIKHNLQGFKSPYQPLLHPKKT